MKFENINIAYENRVICKNFSLEINENQITCIVGKSGCGKTTLLNYISDKLIEMNKRLSYVFQEDRLLTWKTVYDNLTFVGRECLKKEELDKIVISTLRELDLLKYKEYYPNELSGGMRQRVNIARAIICRPEILVLDEPMKSLDKINRDRIIEMISRENKQNGTMVIMVTHNIEEVEALADYLMVIGGEPITLINKYEKNVINQYINEIRTV